MPKYAARTAQINIAEKAVPNQELTHGQSNKIIDYNPEKEIKTCLHSSSIL